MEMNALEKLCKGKEWDCSFERGTILKPCYLKEDVRTALLEYADELLKTGKMIDVYSDYWEGERNARFQIASEIRKAVKQ